jgi:hypothetical protein
VWDVLNAVVEAVEVHAIVGDNSALCIAEGASCEADQTFQGWEVK